MRHDPLSPTEWYGVDNDTEDVIQLLQETNSDWFANELRDFGGVTQEYLTEREGVIANLDQAIIMLTGLRECVKTGEFK